MVWAMEAPIEDHAVFRVLIALANNAGDDGSAAFLAQGTIAARVHTTERTVRRCLVELEAAGYIRRGDQNHERARGIPANRRPVVWALNLTGAYDRSQQTGHGWPVTGRPERSRGDMGGRAGVSDKPTTKPNNLKPTPEPKPTTKALVLLPEDDAPEESSSESFLLDVEVEPYFAPRPQPSFEDFYAAYPRHVRKDSARTAWTKVLKRGVPPELIIAGAVRYATDPNRDRDLNFIPHPASWLNGGGWDDEPCTPRTNGREPTSSGLSSGERAALQALEAGREIAAERAAAAATNHHQQIGTGT